MKTIDRKVFFTYIRRAPFGNKISPSQRDGVEKYLDYWENHYSNEDYRRLAYVLASVFHETYGWFHPIKETVYPYHKNKNPSDAEVIRRLENAFKSGKLKSVRTPYWREGFFGRGGIQITHEDNYKKFGIADNPSLASDPDKSVESAFRGMAEGLFAPGHKLSRYFKASVEDPVGARRIVNGTDKATLIAKYYENFKDALEHSFKPEEIKDVPEEDVEGKSESIIKDPQTIVVTGATAGSSLIAAITSPWGVAGLVVLVAAVGIGLYLYFRKKEKYENG